MSNVESTQAPLDRGKVRVIAKSSNDTVKRIKQEQKSKYPRYQLFTELTDNEFQHIHFAHAG